ncbi:MAG: 30S ribosomal protein S7 [Chlamydiia bacterium]
MSRRHQAAKREIKADEKYGSEVIAKLINLVMERGKKTIAKTIVYDALDLFCKKTGHPDAKEGFEKALENASPLLEVKSRRVGGANYQVPIETTPQRRLSLALRWIISHSRKKSGQPMHIKLANELIDCFNHTGSSVKKKEDTHRMAEANKAFAHFRW